MGNRLQNAFKSQHFTGILAVLLLALFTYRVLHFLHLPHLESLANVSYQPITGHPYWRAFQNRLLGAAALQGISKILNIPLLAAFKLFSLGMLTFIFVSAYLLFDKLEIPKHRKSILLGAFAFLFLVLQDQRWLLAWDFIDVAVFLFLFYGIFKRKGWKYFILLFIVGITNRESALFISLWLIIDSIKVDIREIKITGWNLRKGWAGMLSMIGGVIYTWWIRQTLFIESHAQHVGRDMDHAMVSNHWNLPANLEAFLENIVYLQLDVVGTVFAAIILIFIVRNVRKMDETAIKASLLITGMILSIWLFGLINELRQYLMLIPTFLLLLQQVKPAHPGTHENLYGNV